MPNASFGPVFVVRCPLPNLVVPLHPSPARSYWPGGSRRNASQVSIRHGDGMARVLVVVVEVVDVTPRGGRGDSKLYKYN